MEQAPWWATALLILGGALFGAFATLFQQYLSDRRQAKIRAQERAEEREWSRRAEMKAALRELRLAVDEIDSYNVRHNWDSRENPEGSLTQSWVESDPTILTETLNKIRGLALEVGHPALRAAFIDDLDLEEPEELYKAILEAYEDVNRPQAPGSDPPVDN